MHVLVTGGAGFIGSHSVDHLRAQGAVVRVLDNFSSGKMANLAAHPGLDVVHGDIRDPAAVERAFDGISHVLQLAAQVSVAASVERPLDSSGVNVAGFLTVLDAARRHGVRRFVYASSSAVYGAADGIRAAETTPLRPISPYGLDKAVDDLYAALYMELYGLPCLGLRYFNVFGPRQDASSPYSGVISVFVQALRACQPLSVYGDGGQTRDFIFVGDVARSNALALDAPLTGTCNVATGRSISLLDLADLLGQVAGRAPQLRLLAPRAGDIRHSLADNTRLRTELGLTAFTDVATGLDRLWHVAPNNQQPTTKEFSCESITK